MVEIAFLFGFEQRPLSDHSNFQGYKFMQINTAIIGLGNVGLSLLGILVNKAERLKYEYDISFRIVMIADSQGVAISNDGFNPSEIIEIKSNGGDSADFPGYRGRTPVETLLKSSGISLVFEASPVDLRTGGSGLTITREALRQGIPVVLANKGPVVLAFAELMNLSRRTGAGLKFSATVCGGLPILNIGQRDMIGGEIRQLRGVFNATTNFILEQMAAGSSSEQALAEAQRVGAAESDPSLDLDGWDSANKLLIVANTLWGAGLTLEDVKVTGISGVTAKMLATEAARGNTVKLVASAESGNLIVSPLVLPRSDFLAQCNGWEMGVEIHSDIYGISCHKLWEREPTPTAASMLRDAVHIFRFPGMRDISQVTATPIAIAEPVPADARFHQA